MPRPVRSSPSRTSSSRCRSTGSRLPGSAAASASRPRSARASTCCTSCRGPRRRRAGSRTRFAGSRDPHGAPPRPQDARMNVSRLLVLLGALGLAVAACGGPVSATRVDRRTVQHDLARSALTTGDPSWPTRNVLFERGLFDAFDARPEATLADLHRSMVAASGDPDVLFALAELAYLYGQAAAKPEYQLAAAVYAYAFLFPEGAGAQPGRFDPRLRLAADLYNWGLATGFASAEGSEVVPRGGVFALPFGRMEVAFDEAALRIGQREMHRFIPTAELEVDGLAMRYRRPGLGTPLAASTRPVDGPGANPDLVAPRLKVPVTALLRIPGGPPGPRAGASADRHARTSPGLRGGVGLDRRRAGSDRERALGRPGVHLHGRADRAARSRGEGSRPPADGADRAQPGRAPGQDAGDQQRQSSVGLGLQQAAR